VADNTTTPNKGLLKPIVGNSDNTWGGYLNTTIDSLDSILGGTLTLALTANTTLTAAQAVTTGYRFTGTLAATTTVTYPGSYRGLVVVRNDTTQILSCGIAGAKVAVPNGQTVLMWSNGTDFTTTPLPAGATTVPKMDGAAAAGTAVTWAHSDHVHPTDSTLLPKTGGVLTGGLTVASGGILYSGIPSGPHAFGFGWDGSNLSSFVDGTNVGKVAMQSAITGYLPLAGGTISGSLAVTGNLTCGDGRMFTYNNGGYQSCVGAWNQKQNVAVGFWCENDGTMGLGGVDGTGAPVSRWMQVTSGGFVNIAGNLGGAILVGSNYIRGNAGVYASTDNIFGLWTSGINRIHAYASGWYWGWNTSTGELAWIANNALLWSQRAADGLCFNNLGRVAGHGPYADLSDERSKSSIEPTKVGLPEILKINPIKFRRIKPDGQEGEDEIGFSAQQVQKIIPEAVPVLGIKLPDGSGGIDTDEPTLGVSSEVITVALVNAIKTLNRRLKKLEKPESGNSGE